MRKIQVEQMVIESGDQKVPAKIYRELRRNVRFSVGRKGAILRMPLLLPVFDQKKEIDAFRNWILCQLKDKQELRTFFTRREYQNGDLLQVGNKQYLLTVQEAEGMKNCTAGLRNSLITLKLPPRLGAEERHRAIKHLLSRIVARDFLPDISLRVHQLNQLHFNKKIGKISLKYNRSNWGSCSSLGNINLSTCLLFAPQTVIDYVIIHELSHLAEMNHSGRFWENVQQAMPDYKSQEDWLKKNWQHCDF